MLKQRKKRETRGTLISGPRENRRCVAAASKKIVAIVICLLALAQIATQARAQREQCKQTILNGTINAEEGYSHSFAPSMYLRLAPLGSHAGWVISVRPKDSDEDWTFPVTFPIRTGEQQILGTGWGSTVQEKLAYPRVVQFVLTHSDFVQYSKLATETLASLNPEAAGEFVKKVSKLKQGRITVVALQYGKVPQLKRSNG